MGVRIRTRIGRRPLRLACGRFEQPLQDGQHEGGRLARARLGAGEQVAAGEDERDGFALTGVGSV